MKHGLPDETIAKLSAIFAKHPKVHTVILFGSRAKGNFKNGSDIDLSLKADPLTHSELNQIKMQIDDLMLPYTVDVNQYETISNPELKAHIDRVEEIIYPDLS